MNCVQPQIVMFPSKKICTKEEKKKKKKKKSSKTYYFPAFLAEKHIVFQHSGNNLVVIPAEKVTWNRGPNNRNNKIQGRGLGNF